MYRSITSSLLWLSASRQPCIIIFQFSVFAEIERVKRPGESHEGVGRKKQVCASGIQLDLLQKNRLVGASSECRDALKSNTRDIFLLWIWSCIDSLEIVFCDCSMLCRGCPWTWKGCIENWVLVSVQVACDCKDWFVFSMIIQNFWTSAEDGWLIAPALGLCTARLL